MRRWNELAPYSAGQVMQVTGSGEMERWRAAAESVVMELGLGKPSVSANGRQVTFQPAPFVAVDRAAGDLEKYFTEELNRPFGAEESPLRFFLMAGPERPGAGPTHYFGVIYDHWIADSRAMRDLMHRIFLRYQQLGANGLPGLTLETPEFCALFGGRMGRLKGLTAFWESAKDLVRHRRAFRINLRDPLDFTSCVIYRRFPTGVINRVHQWAKAHGASVNDAFLAVLGQTMGQYTADERYKKRKRLFHLQRSQVGLGTIVDIRDAASQSLDGVFGLYLSGYTVVLEKPENDEAGQLVRRVNACTRRIKGCFMTVRGVAALAMAERWWGFYRKPKGRALLFHKNVPTVAGISNVNMSQSWVDRSEGSGGNGPEVLDYLRVSPTGPLLPLVFTLTTIGEQLSLCVTYRTTAFTAEQAEGLVADFMRRLGELR